MVPPFQKLDKRIPLLPLEIQQYAGYTKSCDFILILLLAEGGGRVSMSPGVGRMPQDGTPNVRLMLKVNAYLSTWLSGCQIGTTKHVLKIISACDGDGR